MNHFIAASLVFLGNLSIAAYAADDNPISIAEKYAALLAEYGPVSSALRSATTDLQRKAAVERLSAYPSKFLDLAEKDPNDPIVLEILRQSIQALSSSDSAAQIAWETNRSDFPIGASEETGQKIVALLLRDHVQSDKLGPVIDRVRYAYRLEFETFLRAVLEKNPHHDVRGLACLALAQFLHDRLRMLQLIEDQPELNERFDIVFGNDFIPRLKRLGRDNLGANIELLFERAVEEFGDIKVRGSTIGEQAQSALYEIHHLSVGNHSPDIEGKDQEGAPFKLSDYHGKVVLLYFWSEY